MKPVSSIGARLDALAGGEARPGHASEMLRLGEEILEHWVQARGMQPTREKREGFRLLALHRQGAEGLPSFNACRETCRELVYHYNLLTLYPGHLDAERNAAMMALVANHLFLFISGKMETEQLGEFCCSSRPVRTAAQTVT